MSEGDYIERDSELGVGVESDLYPCYVAKGSMENVPEGFVKLVLFMKSNGRVVPVVSFVVNQSDVKSASKLLDGMLGFRYEAMTYGGRAVMAGRLIVVADAKKAAGMEGLHSDGVMRPVEIGDNTQAQILMKEELIRKEDWCCESFEHQPARVLAEWLDGERFTS